MKKIVILGATSAIAKACARRFAGEGAGLFLVGRDPRRLEIVAEDLRVRGASDVVVAVLDVESIALVVEAACMRFGVVDLVLVAQGMLPDQAALERNPELIQELISVNTAQIMIFLSYWANVFEAQNHGQMAVIGSVAGDRGRQSNYFYGATKAALSAFLQGLRQRLAKKKINVLEVKPGFVDTPMTAHITKNKLFVSPDFVAKKILQALAKRRHVIYTPGIWQWIMFIVKKIPHRIYNKIIL